MKTLLISILLGSVLISCDNKLHPTPEEVQLQNSTKSFKFLSRNYSDILKSEFEAKPQRTEFISSVYWVVAPIFSNFYKNIHSKPSKPVSSEVALVKKRLSETLDTLPLWKNCHVEIKLLLKNLGASNQFIAENEVANFEQWLLLEMVSQISPSCFRRDFIDKVEVYTNSAVIPIVSDESPFYQPEYKLTKLTRDGKSIDNLPEFKIRHTEGTCRIDSLQPGNYKAYVNYRIMDLGSGEYTNDPTILEFTIK